MIDIVVALIEMEPLKVTACLYAFSVLQIVRQIEIE